MGLTPPRRGSPQTSSYNHHGPASKSPRIALAMQRGLDPAVFVLVERFLSGADRLVWFVALDCPPPILAQSPTLVQDVDTFVPDEGTSTTHHVGPAWITPRMRAGNSRFDIYVLPSLLRLVLIDDRFSHLRWRKIRLASTLERECDVSIVRIFLDRLDTIPTNDLERSCTLLTALQQAQKPCRYSAEQIDVWSERLTSHQNRSLHRPAHKEDERESMRFTGGVNAWAGAIHRSWLNGAFDLDTTEQINAVPEPPSSALCPPIESELDDTKRSLISSLSQSVVDRVVMAAASRICAHIAPELICTAPASDDFDADGDSDNSSGSMDESESESENKSESGDYDYDCDRDSESDNESESSSSLCRSFRSVDDSSGVDEAADGPTILDAPPPVVFAVLELPASTDCQVDPLYNLDETDDGEHVISSDATRIREIAKTAASEGCNLRRGEYDVNLSACMPTAEEVVGRDSSKVFDSVPPFVDTESEVPPAEICPSITSISTSEAGTRLFIKPSAAQSSPAAVVSCAVTWTSSSATDLEQLSDLHVGDRVDARFRGREPWLRGHIARCHCDKLAFDVLYDDGEHEEAVAREYIKLVACAAEESDASKKPRTSRLVGSSSSGATSGVSDSHGLSLANRDDHDEAVAVDPPADPLALISIAPDADTSSSEGSEPRQVSSEFAEAIPVGPETVDSTDKANSSTDPSASRELERTHEVLADGEPSEQQELLANPVSSVDDVIRDKPGRGRFVYLAGQSVEANFLSIGKFHPAKIVHVHGDSEAFDVTYSEFDQTELRVSPANIRPPRASTRRMKALLTGSPSIVVPIETVVAMDRSLSSNMVERPLDANRTSDPSSRQDNKADEIRQPLPSPPVAPLSIPPAEHTQKSLSGRSDSCSTSSISRHEDGREQERSRPSSRAAVSSREVDEWRNVDIILSRKRRLLNAPTGSVENTKVPWGEEFATIQSLKRFATQHPDVLREHIVSQLSELGIQSKSPTRGSPPLTRPSSQMSTVSARETLLMIKDLAFLLRQRLSPFFDDIVPIVLPAIFSSDRRFLCDTAYDVLEALVLHCSCRKLALVLLQQGAQLSSQEDPRLLNLTSVYVEKCFANFSTSEIGALARHAPSKSSTTIAQLLAQLLASKSIPTRIAIEKSLLHIQQELGERRFKVFLRTNLEPAQADKVLLSDKLNTARDAVSGAHSPAHKSPRKSQRGRERNNGGATACQSPSILQRMLQQRHSRVRPSPSHT